MICERTTPLGEESLRLIQRFRVCCTQGFTRNVHEVGLCELEAGPLPVADELPIAEEEDVLDYLTSPSADPFATVEQATLAVRPHAAGRAVRRHHLDRRDADAAVAAPGIWLRQRVRSIQHPDAVQERRDRVLRD